MNISGMIDHTLLKADSTKVQIETLCKEAIEYNFAAVCVNPWYVDLCCKLLHGTSVKVATVVGFPLGSNTKEVKAFEAKDAISNGADEIDMVINISALKDKNYNVVKEDIEAVLYETRGKAILKTIIETCLLNDEEKKKICEICIELGVDYIKTSTGFSTGGATVEDIKLIRSVIDNKALIKASGGLKDLQIAKDMIEAGANRLGTSSGVKIVKEL